jgi:hypothetical protein
MAIEVVPGQLYALAAALDAAASSAGRAGAALVGNSVGGPLDDALTGFCEATGAAGRFLAAELGWLGRAVTVAADSWQSLDRSLLPGAGRGGPE